MGKLLLALAAIVALTGAQPEQGSRVGDVTLYAPEMMPRHFRGVRFDWSSGAAGCLKLYPEDKPALWFCGTYEVRGD